MKGIEFISKEAQPILLERAVLARRPSIKDFMLNIF